MSNRRKIAADESDTSARETAIAKHLKPHADVCMPDVGGLHGWLEKQTTVIFRAQSIADLVAISLDRDDHQEKFHNEWSALQTIHEMLGNVAGALEKPVIEEKLNGGAA